MKKTRAAGALVLALTAVMPSAALAATPSPTIDIADVVLLQAKGAAVEVGVAVTCTADPSGWPNTATVTYQLTQKISRGLVTADSDTRYNVTCDGTPQDLTFVLVPSTYAFKKGVALASVTAQMSMAVVPPVTETVKVK